MKATLMELYNCLLNRECDRRSWIKSELIEARDPEEAAERYLSELSRCDDDRWEGFEDQSPVVVRVTGPNEDVHDFEVTPFQTFEFKADELEPAN